MKGGESKSAFVNLPKVSRENLALESVISATALKGETLNQLLLKAIDECEVFSPNRIKIEFESCKLQSRENALASVGIQSLCVYGHISKEKIPFTLVFQERAVIDLVYLLLSSTSETPSQKTTLSAVEDGIFSFVLAMIFGALQNSLVDTLGTSFNFGPLEKPTALFEMFSSHSQLLSLNFDLSVNELRSSVRLLVAANPVASLTARPSALLSRDEIVSRGLLRASDIKVSVSAVIGQLSLAPDDVKALEIDDIVVLESSRVKMSGSVLTGELDCNLGEPLFAKATAQISLSQNGRYLMQISSLQPTILADEEIH